MSKVKDVIEEGQPIPVDVTEVEDRHGQRWEPIDFYVALEFGPLTVTAVREPEPERRARVGDLIAEAPIPANVVEGVIAKTPWTRTAAGWQTPAYPDTQYAGVHTCQTDRAVLSYGQMVVTSVGAAEPATEPQQPAPSVLLDLVRQYGERCAESGSTEWADIAEEGERRAAEIFERIAALVPDPDKTCADCGCTNVLHRPQPDPSVLSLPQVPPGTVALIGGRTGRRYERYSDSWRGTMATLPLGDLLQVERSVSVVMREPRTWQPGEAPDDVTRVKDITGIAWTRPGPGTDSWVCPDRGDSGNWSYALWKYGPLVEVFDDGGER